MREKSKQGALFSDPPAEPGVIVINDRCVIRTDGIHRVVMFSGLSVASYVVEDRMSEAHAMVSLVERGYADQNDVARSFGCSTRTLRRNQRRYEDKGLAALGHGHGYPKGRSRLKSSSSNHVERLKRSGSSNREIARALGVSEKAVRKVLRRLGWKEPTPEQLPLFTEDKSADPKLSAFSETPLEEPVKDPPASADPNVSAFSHSGDSHDSREEPSFTLDKDPSDRRMDRLLAYLGLIDDAAPLFQDAQSLPKAGVLLAVPALVQGGVFRVAKSVYGSLGAGFYGLRTCMMVMLLMALLRIKRPEALKEHAPAELGTVIGLDRAPEVKTLRRKLSRLALLGKAAEFGHELAASRVAMHGERMGFLYVDGHVRVYHGKHSIPKAHVARMRLPMPATTDYWVGDSVGDPLFVVTADANAGLCKMLPGLLDEARSLIGERRLTVVFDRGGWSPALFRTLIIGGFDILTYRKGRSVPIPADRFSMHEAVIDGKSVKYNLADTGVELLKGELRLRQITWLSDDGTHQTPIVTSRRDLSPLEIAYRMFERWRQENFFKYLREEYALDVLADHQIEPDNPNREVPNPVWHKLDSELKTAQARLDSLLSSYGLEALGDPEHLRKTMRAFKGAPKTIKDEITAAMKTVAEARAMRDKAPGRVPVCLVVKGEVVKLVPEKKLLTNILKMVAYQAESELFRMVTPHYNRAEDEGRTLIQAALSSSADIKVTDTELRVIISPQSSAHRTKAIDALCADLNRTPTVFPGTKLRLRYAVKSPP